jgi:hypothetical protein
MAALICIAARIKPSSPPHSMKSLLDLQNSTSLFMALTIQQQMLILKSLNSLVKKGVDFFLNKIGISSIPDDVEMIRRSGSIALVGFLGRLTADYSPQVLLTLCSKRPEYSKSYIVYR